MTGLMIVTLIVSVLACAAVFVVVDVLTTGIIKRMKKEVFRYIKQYNEQMQVDAQAEVAATMQSVVGADGVPEREEQLAIPFIPKAQPMQKQDFFSDYRKVRECFHGKQEEVIAQIPMQDKAVTVKYGLVCKILEKLSFDSLYEISCLPEEKQLLVLDEVLDAKEKTILAEYRESRNGVFDCAEFYSYLKNKQAEYDDTIYYFVGKEEDTEGITDERVRPCADEAILEGFQLLHGGYLYDYGVRSSELR